MKATQYTSVTKLVKRSAFALAFATTSLAPIPSLAAPLVFETEAAKIIVARPLDVWSPDKAASEASLLEHKRKVADFFVKENGKRLSKNSSLIKRAQEELQKKGFQGSSWTISKNNVYIEDPISATSDQMSNFALFQDDVYQRLVVAQGNPDDLETKATRDKYFGALLSIGTVVAGSKYFGLGRGTDLTLGTGLASDIYQTAVKFEGSIVPLEIGFLDFRNYRHIDIRKVLVGQQPILGQIIIAYKDEKTEAAEHEALVIAVVALTGANSTTAEIEQARKEDFARRKAIWDKCLADGGGTCKPEPIRRGGG